MSYSRYYPVSKGGCPLFFSQALPLGISLFFNGAYLQQDILILKHFTDDIQVGLFSSGYRIIVAIVAFITPAFAVLLPEFSRKATQSHSDVSLLGGKIAQLFLGAMIPAVVVLALLSKWLLVFLFGQDFAAAAPVLQFLAAVLFLRSLEYLFALGMISVNKSWWVLIVAITGLVVNVALNWIWIPKWGFMGAVYGKLVAEIVVFCVAMGLFQLASRGSLFPKWITTPIISGIIMLAAMYVSRSLGTLAAFLIALVFYVIVFLVFERTLIRDVLHLGIKR